METINLIFVDLALYILIGKFWEVSQKYLHNKRHLSFEDYFAIFCIVTGLNFFIN